jgi:hypothetical protein
MKKRGVGHPFSCPLARTCFNYIVFSSVQTADLISDVQLGHLVALIGIVVKQTVQSFVVGSGGGASSFAFNLFICCISRNIANATMRKLMIVLINVP